MYTQVIEFATPQFDVALRLRDQVLRKPLKMEFYPEDIARRNGCSKFELHARDTAVRFYEKMNYTTVGEKFTEVGIPHYKMEKKLS